MESFYAMKDNLTKYDVARNTLECCTYVFKAGVVVLADVVQLVDEDRILLAQIVIAFTYSIAS